MSRGAVYPEYFLALYSEDDEAAEKAEGVDLEAAADETAPVSNAVEEAAEERDGDDPLYFFVVFVKFRTFRCAGRRCVGNA